MTEDFSPAPSDTAPLPQVVTPTPVVPAQPAAPSVPAGWMPDPQNSAMQRYWDGQVWTDHTAPAVAAHAAPAPPPMPQQQIVIQNGGGVRTSHGLHLFLTIITLGLWAPVWIIVTLVNRSKQSKPASGYYR